jgi:hypothetical protein
MALFDLSPSSFPFRSPVPSEIERRRASLSDVLIFDILLSLGGIQVPEAHAIYPPSDPASLRTLLDAIETSSYDTLKKDSLVYFLLKWHKDAREEEFAQSRCIPPQFVKLADAYWHLDVGADVSVSGNDTSYLHHHQSELRLIYPFRKHRKLLFC